MDFAPNGRTPGKAAQSKNQPSEGEGPGSDQAEALGDIAEGGQFPTLSLYSPAKKVDQLLQNGEWRAAATESEKFDDLRRALVKAFNKPAE